MKRDRGFTLVELLLAVTLLSMLMALTYGGLQAATRTTDRGQKILQESGRLRMAHQFVRKQINQAIPLGFNQVDDVAAAMGEPPLSEVFIGTRASIRFVGPMPGYLGFGGPQVQELSLVNGDEGMELVLTHALLQGFEDANLNEREPIVLIDHIESAEFSFLARDEEGEIAGWVSDWEETAKLPVAMSLEIQFEEGAYTDWPLLVAVVKVDASAVDNAMGGDTSYQSAVQELIDKRRQQN